MKISVITVTFNALDSLRETLNSVAAQNHENVEYIVVDGGSTDGTVEFLEAHSMTVTRFISEPDRGIYDAMNKGISLATGDILNFLNCGDVYYDNGVLKRIASEFENNKSDIVCCDFIVNLNGRLYFRQARPRFDKAYQRMPTNHQAMFYRRTIFHLKQYDTTYLLLADYDHILHIITKTNASISIAPYPAVIYLLGGVSDVNRVRAHLEGFHISVKHYGWFKGVIGRGPRLFAVWLKKLLIDIFLLEKQSNTIRVFLYGRKNRLCSRLDCTKQSSRRP